MGERLREELLTSYANMGEAMVAQNVLEAGGVPCRIGDLANIPSHLYGVFSALGRSVGLWVLDVDVERAASILAAGLSENEIDETALAAEAMAAAPAAEEEAEVEETAAPGAATEADPSTASEFDVPAPIAPRHSSWLAFALFAFIITTVAVLLFRGSG